MTLSPARSFPSNNATPGTGIIGLEVISVPLHIVHLTSQLVCGPVMVGVTYQ